MSVGSDRNPKGSSQAKVSQFNVALTTDQEILWLQVSVQYPMGMTVGNAIYHLV